MQSQSKATSGQSDQMATASRLSKHCLSSAPSGKVYGSSALSSKVMQLSDTLRQFLLRKSTSESLPHPAAAPSTGRAVSPCISKGVGPLLHNSPAAAKQHLAPNQPQREITTASSLSTRGQQHQRALLQPSLFSVSQAARPKSTDRSQSAQRTHQLVRCGAAQPSVAESQINIVTKSSLAVKQTLASRSREMFSQRKLVSSALECNEEFVKQSIVLPTYQQTKLKQRVVEAATAARLNVPSNWTREENDAMHNCGVAAAPSRDQRLFGRLHSAARSNSAPGRSSSSQRSPQSIEVVVLTKPREPIQHRKVAAPTSNPSPAASMPRDCGSAFIRPPPAPSKTRDSGWRQPTPSPSTGNNVVRVLSSGVRVGITYTSNTVRNRSGSPPATVKPAATSSTLHRQSKKSLLSLSGSLLKERLLGSRCEPPSPQPTGHAAKTHHAPSAKEKAHQPQVLKFSKKLSAVSTSSNACLSPPLSCNVLKESHALGKGSSAAPPMDDAALSPISSRSASPRRERVSWRRNVEVFEPIPVADLHRFCVISPRGRDVTPPTARGGVIFERIPFQLEKPKPVALYSPPASIQAICQRVRGEVSSAQ